MSAVGIFDSGVGGLTVAGAFVRALPNESIVYLGDTARVPYGNKSPETVRRYAERCADFLYAQDVKLMIIACNTATAFALEALQIRYPVPVIGVIAPSAQAALAASSSGRIAVIGTHGTIASGAYRRAIVAQRADAQVLERACPLFVPLAEEGWSEHPATALIVREYLAEVKAHQPDVLVLGCTHYPILAQAIARELGDSVQLCDSAETVTATARDVLRKRGALSSGSAVHRFFMTDAQPQLARIAELFFGQPLGVVERIDL